MEIERRRTETIFARQRLSEQNTLLQHLSRIDALTGVANRRTMEERLRSHLEEFRRYGTSVAVSLFDIDHFKRVNDTNGHGIGDQVLRELSSLVRRELRRTRRCIAPRPKVETV